MGTSGLDASAVMDFFASPHVGIYSNAIIITAATGLTVFDLIGDVIGLLTIAVGVAGFIVAVWMLRTERHS